MGNYHKNQQKNFILQIKFMNKKKFICLFIQINNDKNKIFKSVSFLIKLLKMLKFQMII